MATAPSYVAKSSAQGSGSVTPAMPTGATSGDFLILSIVGKGDNANADAAPEGWNYLNTVAGSVGPAGTAVRLTNYWAWYRSDISRAVPDAGSFTIAGITAWRNVNRLNPFDVTPVTSSEGYGSRNTSVSITGVTTTTANTRIVAISASGDNNSFGSWANANLESISEILEQRTTAGDDGTLAIAHGEKATAGATGTTTATINAAEEEANCCIALRSNDHGPIVQFKRTSVGQSDSTISVTLDDTPTEDNLLVAIYAGGGLFSGWASCTGFTDVDHAWDGTAWFGHTVFTKKAGASESATVTVTPADTDSGWLLVLEIDADYLPSGFTASNVYDQGNENTGSSGTSLTGASITTTDANTLSIVGACYWQSSTTDTIDDFDCDTGWEKVLQEGNAGGGGDNEFQGACFLRALESTGTYNPTVSWDDSSSGSMIFQVTLEMAAAATVETVSPTGAATPTGALELEPQHTLTGSATPTGAATKEPTQSLTGAATPTGSTSKAPRHSPAGTAPVAGQVGKTAAHVPTGSISTAGTITKAISRALTGAAATAGNLTRAVTATYTGTLPGAGTLDTLRLKLLAVAGTITATGSITRAAARALTGSTAPTGATTSGAATKATGTATPTGAVTKSVTQTITGAIASAASLATQAISGTIRRTFTGAATLAGDLATHIATSLAGSIDTEGDINRTATTSAYTGASTPTGVTTKTPKVTPAGSIASSSTIIRTARTALAGIAAPAGSIYRTVRTALAGTAGSASTLVQGIPGELISVTRRIRSTRRSTTTRRNQATTIRRDTTTTIRRKDFDT